MFDLFAEIPNSILYKVFTVCLYNFLLRTCRSKMKCGYLGASLPSDSYLVQALHEVETSFIVYLQTTGNYF